MTQPGAPHDQRHNYQQQHGVPHAQPFPGASQKDHPSAGTTVDGQMIAGTQEERLLAAASYLTWLAGFWLVGPIAIYFLFKDKSRFVSFHAVQSVIVSVGLTVLMPVMWIASMVASFAGIYAVGNSDVAGIVMVAMYGVWMLSALVPLLFMLIGAWRAFHGVSWRVPLAGRLADRFLTQQTHNSTQQGVSS